MRAWIILVLFLGYGSASPVAEPATTAAAFCPVVTSLVTKAKAQATATSFCSSYLGIKTSTARTTVPSTTIVTETEIVATTTVTASTTSTVFVEPTCTAAVTLKRRAVAKPAVFSAYKVATAISSACKCLSIPTPTTVVTATSGVITKTSTVKGTSTVTVATATVTETGDSTQEFFPRATGGSANGKWARRITNRLGDGGFSISFDQTEQFNSFAFTKTCGLRIVQGFNAADGYVCWGAPGQKVDCRFPGAQYQAGYGPLTCATLGESTLSCSTQEGASVNNACTVNGDELMWVLDFGAIEGCTQFFIEKT